MCILLLCWSANKILINIHKSDTTSKPNYNNTTTVYHIVCQKADPVTLPNNSQDTWSNVNNLCYTKSILKSYLTSTHLFFCEMIKTENQLAFFLW